MTEAASAEERQLRLSLVPFDLVIPSNDDDTLDEISWSDDESFFIRTRTADAASRSSSLLLHNSTCNNNESCRWDRDGSRDLSEDSALLFPQPQPPPHDTVLRLPRRKRSSNTSAASSHFKTKADRMEVLNNSCSGPDSPLQIPRRQRTSEISIDSTPLRIPCRQETKSGSKKSSGHQQQHQQPDDEKKGGHDASRRRASGATTATTTTRSSINSGIDGSSHHNRSKRLSRQQRIQLNNMRRDEIISRTG